MKKKILIIGFTGVRLDLTCERLPYAGEKTDGIKYGYTPDCLAAASAVTAVGMGTDAVLLTRVGNDGNGAKLLSVLSENGVDTKYCVKDRKAPTSLTVVISEDAADKRMIRYRGAAMNLTKGDVEEAFNCNPDAVILRLEGSRDSIKEAEEFAVLQEAPLFVCAADIENSDSVYLPKVAHTFIGDARSVLAFTGIAPTNAESALRAAIELQRNKINANNFIFRMNNGNIYVYDNKYGRILGKRSKGHSFCDVYAPTLVSEYMKCGNIYSSARFALDATSLWEACGETFDSVPTAAEVRRDAQL